MSNQQYGNTATYTAKRLKRDRPDLFQQVLDGKLSVNAAGFRKPTTPCGALERAEEMTKPRPPGRPARKGFTAGRSRWPAGRPLVTLCRHPRRPIADDKPPAPALLTNPPASAGAPQPRRTADAE